MPVEPMSKEALVVLAIQLMRIKQGHPLLPNRRMQLLFSGHEDLPDLIFTSEQFPNLSDSQLNSEKQF